MSDHTSPRDPDEDPSTGTPPDELRDPPPVSTRRRCKARLPSTRHRARPASRVPATAAGPGSDHPPRSTRHRNTRLRPPYPHGTATAYRPPQRSGTNSKAIIALVCGIAGLALCQLIGVAAILVGGSARREIQVDRQGGYGLALAGVVLGWIAVALTVGLLPAVRRRRRLSSRSLPSRRTHSTGRPRPRAISIRWTSEVPSPISSTLASR